MTLREKLEIEHPECIDEKWHGGCKDCPHQYGYKKMEECECDSKTVNDEICRKCWDQKYEGELTPQEKKIEELKRELLCVTVSRDHNIDLLRLREKEDYTIERYIEDKTDYTVYSWEFANSVKNAVDGLLNSRNRWRAAFIGLLVGNITAFILQLLI